MSDILLVEDDDSIREMVHDMLGDEGYAVVSAVEGHAALTYLQECRELPQLILLDLMMPGMNGLQFLQVQQADPRLAAVPVILFSAASELEQLARTMAIDYLPKPFDITALLATVEHYCCVACQPCAAFPA